MSEHPLFGGAVDQHDEKLKATAGQPGRQYDDWEPSAAPIAPDGGLEALAAVGDVAAVPDATPELMICARGPCRYYWVMRNFFDCGNPANTFEGPDRLVDPISGKPVPRPRETLRTCLAHPGWETDITQQCVYECTRWDPLLPEDTAQVELRRQRYYDANPEHRPSEEEIDDGPTRTEGGRETASCSDSVD